MFDLILERGEALYIPPGFIHETLNLGDTCAASVTYQFPTPMATGLYRNFLKRVRRTPDIWESWPLLKEWSTFGTGTQGHDSKSVFNLVDMDKDGKVTVAEVGRRVRLQRSEPDDVVAFHDIDKDGSVSFVEFDTQYKRWHAMEKDAMTNSPDIGLGLSFEQLHYQALEDIGYEHGRKLGLLQKQTLAKEQALAPTVTFARSDEL